MALTAPTADLTGNTIASTYDQLLILDNADGIVENTLKIVSTQLGRSSLQIDDEKVLIKGVDTSNAAAFEVQQTGGTSIFKVAAGTPALTINAATVTLTQDTDFVTSGGVNGMSIDGTTFSVDGTNNRVGIGTASPATALHLSGAVGATSIIKMSASDGTAWELGERATAGHFTFRELDGNKDVLTMKSTGYVGIGTTAPTGGNLHIKTTSSFGTALMLENTSGVHGSILQFNNNSASPANADYLGGIFFSGDDAGGNSTTFAKIWGIAETVAEGNEDGAIIFETSANATSAERVRIDSAGNVGIGVTDPDNKLEIVGGSDAPLTLKTADTRNGIFLKKPGTDTVMGSILLLADESFRFGTESVYNMTLLQNGNVGIGTAEPGYQLDLRKNDTGTTASLGIRQLGSGDASMAFQTTTSPYGFCIGVDGSDSDAFKIATGLTDVGTNTKITITTAGYINAPSLNQTGSTSNRYPLYWVHTGTTGSIEPYTGSIRAMKTDIADMGTVDWIHSLTPRSFKFRDFEDIDGVRTYKDTTNDNPITEYGLIAEEVDEVSGSDYILDKNSDGELKGVLYHNLVPILLKSIQELSTANDALKSRIEALENA